MRQCDFKKRYDPETDTHVRRHIHGEGIMDTIKSVGKKLFRTKAGKKAATTAADYAGKKAGDKIVKLLTSQNKIKTKEEPSMTATTLVKTPVDPITAQNVNDRISQLLAGGKLRRRNFI